MVGVEYTNPFAIFKGKWTQYNQWVSSMLFGINDLRFPLESMTYKLLWNQALRTALCEPETALCAPHREEKRKGI
jgi:hypothetical protein